MVSPGRAALASRWPRRSRHRRRRRHRVEGGADRVGREREVGIAGEVAGHGLVRVDDGAGAPGLELGERVALPAATMSQPINRSAPPAGDPHGVDVVGIGGDAHVADHGAVLLRQAGLVEDRAALALEMGGHAEQGADGHHAGAADAGDDDAVGRVQGGRRRIGQSRQRGVEGGAVSPGLGPVDGDEAGAEPVHARIVLVARRLVDGALAAELGFQGTMETQLDWTPQSPQPSHTASLIKTRRGGSIIRPRLRRRRFSAAQVWS